MKNNKRNKYCDEVVNTTWGDIEKIGREYSTESELKFFRDLISKGLISKNTSITEWAKLDKSKLPKEEIGEGMYNERTIQKLKWENINGNERTAIEESTDTKIDVTYEILSNQQTSLNEVDGYMVNRISNDYKYADGILGCFEEEVGVCCGIGMYSAIGLPPNGKCNGNIKYVKHMAEMDLRNLEKGIDNVFVSKFFEDIRKVGTNEVSEQTQKEIIKKGFLEK